MPLRFHALAAAMFVASVGSGMGMILSGFGGDLGFDHTLVDIFDALLLWLMISLLPLGLIATFIFAPMAFLLEIHGSREFTPYLAAGAAAGAIPVLLIAGGPPAEAEWLSIFVLPGAAAGLTWWFLAIDRQGGPSRG